jgi:formamidopyrimidine-DNA glycosylase
MPELPEVETVRRTLDPLLRGRWIQSFTAYWPRTVGHEDLNQFSALVSGRTIMAVDRRAKYVVLRLDEEDRISVHLRMTGELLLTDAALEALGDRQRPYLRATFDLGDGGYLHFIDIRKFGRIRWLPAEDWPLFDQSLGVEPLDNEFTPDALQATLQRRRRQMKPLLLDQTVIAGLGNIYVDEALHRAGVHPLTLSHQVDAADAQRIFEAIRTVLLEAVANSGTTLRNYRSGLGEPGTNQRELRIYGRRDGDACRTCGSPIRRIVVGQRGTVYCPTCQPLADRR